MFIEKPASKNSLTLRKSVFGVGINDAPYLSHYTDENGKRFRCPYYVAWSSMIRRCYSKKSYIKNPTYINCSVSKAWLLFSNFREWMITQNWKGRALDKDILKQGNKIYSPDYCLFVPQSLNNLLLDRGSLRGDYPIGVRFCKRDKLIYAYCGVYGKPTHLGCFKTPEEASTAYKQFKSKHILEVAEEYKNEPRLYEALKNHSRMMLL